MGGCTLGTVTGRGVHVGSGGCHSGEKLKHQLLVHLWAPPDPLMMIREAAPRHHPLTKPRGAESRRPARSWVSEGPREPCPESLVEAGLPGLTGPLRGCPLPGSQEQARPQGPVVPGACPIRHLPVGAAEGITPALQTRL